MFYFLLILIPSVLSVFGWKLYYKHEITPKEIGMGLGATLIVSLLLTGLTEMSKYSGMWDTEILNGYVESKAPVEVSCEHSYPCNPRTVCSGSGKSRSCTTVYDTCYDHSYDVDWDVKTTVGTVTIDRVDRQGTTEPPRFTAVQIGEPASAAHAYVNYLKGAKDSLLYTKQETDKNYQDILVSYPRVFDYYRVKTVINQTKLDTRLEEIYLRQRMKELGAKKQVNIIAVFTNQNPDFFNVLLSHWGGVKKNDVLMMFGMKGDTVQWFKSTSFADGMDNRDLHVQLRNNAITKPYSIELFKEQINLVDEKFTRLPNKKFEYMIENIDPPAWLVFINIIVNLFITGIISHQLANNYERERV
ncbi:hypothetical protein VPG01_022 [Vibrio phage VPG01]|nr:hypothetical protein VPG01_022 [Vibrio phage VPG01]